MPAFFAHRRGQVARVIPQVNAPGGVLPLRIIADGMDMHTPQTRAIVTQAAIVENGNFQFLHTLDETVYAYIFGDRIGELRLSGICFSDTCNGQSSGLQQISEQYKKNKISKLGRPVSVGFGNAAMNYIGFLVGMGLEVADAERNLGQWTFRFNTFPGEDNNKDKS